MRDLLSTLDAISNSDLTRINEQQEPTEVQMNKWISDLYKDVYGYRPDRNWGEDWMSKNEDDKRRVYNQLVDMLSADDENIEDPKEYAERSADLDAEHYGKSESIFHIGDEFGISLSEEFEISTHIIGITNEGPIISLDEKSIDYLQENGFKFEDLTEGKSSVNFDAEDIIKLQQLDNVDSMKEKAFELISKPSRRPMKPEKVEWFKNALSKMTDRNQVIKLMYDLLLSGEGIGVIGSRSSMAPSGYRQRFNDSIANEAEYQGRKVELNKPMQGDVKKSKVYVKGPKGNVVKVNFGDKTMRIKKSNPERRKSFRARHNCDNPGPKWKARYWSCRAW